MRVLVQRVAEAAVTVGGREVSRIGRGMLLMVGVEEADGEEDIEWLAGKVARLRIFDDADGVMNLCQAESNQAGLDCRGANRGAKNLCQAESNQAGLDCRGANRGAKNLDVVQSAGEVLAVSQFTLHASTRKGNRPSYIRAARPEVARPLYERFAARLAAEIGREVPLGVFGADMRIALVADGPVTILIDSRNRE